MNMLNRSLSLEICKESKGIQSWKPIEPMGVHGDMHAEIWNMSIGTELKALTGIHGNAVGYSFRNP